MKFGVIIFPGSNCDHDAFWTIQQVAKQPVTFLWHESHDLENCDAIIVPGGFAFGDYLRTGAIAKFSPVMESVRKLCRRRRPGARNLQWLSDSVRSRAAARSAHAQYRPEICLQAGAGAGGKCGTPFTNACSQGEVLTIPIGHMEGNYFCDQPTLDELQREKRIVFRYATPSGEISARANPNGSLDNIAGICSPGR